ncbi:MAG: carbohydrate kinase family protein [Kouleothrix sp.]|nr:carbohydrate kinase family protein [Kouleothrix sp.]
MTNDYDVFLIGSYFCDLIFTGLPELPRLGLDLFGTGFDMVPGASFRVAVALKRLGLRAGWPCDFGDDFFSRFVIDQAEREGIDTGLFRRHPFPLPRVSVAFSFRHDRGFISYMDRRRDPPPIDLVERHRPRAVLISHLAYGDEQAALVEATHAAGGLVYMDCQSDPATLATPGVREAIGRVDIFAPNAAEALHLTGADTLEGALAELADLAPLAIVKRGADGAIARAGEQVAQAPALPVEVLDTTGAGDCFNAGFLYGRLAGWPLELCLRCGNICGALATTCHGVERLPTAGQVADLLSRYPV